MTEIVLFIVLFIGGFVFGGLAIYVYIKYMTDSSLRNADEKSRKMISEAELMAENAKKELEIKAKDEILKSKKEFEQESNKRMNELNQMEQRILQKETRIDEKEVSIDNKEKVLEEKNNVVAEQKEKVEKVYKEQVDKLQKISSFSKEEAKKYLMENLERELKNEAGVKIREYEDYTKQVADKKAKEIISLAIKRCAVDTVTESTTTTITLPNDEMKGRIIGREGRNIRVFENLTGIDLIVDDTPDTVVLSGFDPIRREIAKMALKSLVVDGRIHPTRIEESIEKARKELQKDIKEMGEKVALELDVQNLQPKIYELLGRLKYRTSYGQNVLNHSIEVAYLSSFIAQELGVNYKLALRAGLLHDIGKAVDFEQEGTHTQIGAALLKKYGESNEVIHAMICHHEDVEPQTVEAIIVLVADALSAARPGARRESLESYVKRLEKLEGVASSFEGVEKCYAIQAGREIRVMVKPDMVTDDSAIKLSRDIAKKIEAELEYPGQITVSVIRETRFQDVAK